MKRITFGLLAGVAMFLAGCVVLSVYPFYTEKDLSFEPALLGDWTNTTSAGQHWSFVKEGGQAYQLTCIDEGKPTFMVAHPFKLQGQLFLDLSKTNAADEPFPPGIPSHVLLRVARLTPDVHLAPLKYDWLKDLLTKDPKALRHHSIAGEKPEDRYYVLTADTEELQRFVRKYLAESAAWVDEIELRRAAPKP